VFGYLASDHNHDTPRDKFDETTHRSIFLGYPQGEKVWLLHYLANEKLLVSWDARCHKHVLPYAEHIHTLPYLSIHPRPITDQKLPLMEAQHDMA